MRVTTRRRLLALTGIAILLSGCGGPSDPPTGTQGQSGQDCAIPKGPVALAVGGRANSPTQSLPPEVEQAVHDVVYATPAHAASPRISLIGVDGQPSVITDGAFKSDSNNDPALNSDRERFLSDVRNTVAGVRAKTPEVNDVRALTFAANSVRGSGAGTVVLIDSGLQTMAPLDFRQPGMLDADPEDVVKQLAHDRQLPDLTGLTVIFVGLGYTAPPQPELDNARQSTLVDLYTKLAATSHAACVTNVPAPRSAAAPTGVPAVSIVPIPEPPKINVAPHQTTTLPDDSTVGFVADKAVFRNPAAATSVLTPLAQFLAANPQTHVKVTGTTARVGDRNGQIALANDRAHAVMTVLLQNGAHQDQITTEGLGSYFPGYVPDHAPDGTLLADKAQQNRTVILSW